MRREARSPPMAMPSSTVGRSTSRGSTHSTKREDTPMPAKMYYDQDADLRPAQGQDDRGDRLRQPGARPGAEPARLGLRGGGRPAPGLGQLRRWRSATASSRCRPPRPPRPATWSISSCPTRSRATSTPATSSRTFAPATSCSARTGSTSTSARSSRPRASTAPWSPPRGRATWSAASSSRGAAFPA